MVQSSECPSCGEEIVLSSNIQLGQRVVCPHCDAVLKIVWLDPPELDWIELEEDEEDYDYEEDFLEEDEFDDDFYDDEDEDELDDDEDSY